MSNYKRSYQRAPQSMANIAEIHGGRKPAAPVPEPEFDTRGMVTSTSEQKAETTLRRLKYLDGILSSPNISFESVRDAQREKTRIYDGIGD